VVGHRACTLAAWAASTKLVVRHPEVCAGKSVGWVAGMCLRWWAMDECAASSTWTAGEGANRQGCVAKKRANTVRESTAASQSRSRRNTLESGRTKTELYNASPELLLTEALQDLSNHGH
jgi:hypothetical protein